jgi:hypothetical protein
MCVLRARGVGFDVDGYLASSRFHTTATWRRGDTNQLPSKTLGLTHRDSGMIVSLCDGPWNDLSTQVPAVETFLREHEPELRQLRRFPGVDEVVLDFPIHLLIGDRVAVQSDTFPAPFVTRVGGFGFALKLTIWPPAKTYP